MTFYSLMMAILMNWTGRIVAAFGIGFVSYKGLDGLFNKLLLLVKQKLDGLPESLMQLLLLSGFGDYLNWVMSGIAFAFTLKSATKLTARLRV